MEINLKFFNQPIPSYSEPNPANLSNCTHYLDAEAYQSHLPQPRGRPSIHRNPVYLILPRIEGWDILDNRKGLFCSPTPFALDQDL